MIHKILLLVKLILITSVTIAQYVEVQANYNSLGDCVFSATNNAKVPMYLHINFADLENTTFNETLPYVKKVAPGFNSLFTLQRDVDAEIPRFNYDIETFRSNPTADVDLDFPYLIPLKEGKSVSVFDVKNIDGFWGAEKLKSWFATGFTTQPDMTVFASRSGVVVEITGDKRTGDSCLWYHTWKNSLTILQPDGSLICYHNISCATSEIGIGDKVYAGQKIGEVIPGATELVLLVFHHSLFTRLFSFVIPRFVIAPDGKSALLNSSVVYLVYQPQKVKGLEMTKKERKKILGAR